MDKNTRICLFHPADRLYVMLALEDKLCMRGTAIPCKHREKPLQIEAQMLKPRPGYEPTEEEVVEAMAEAGWRQCDPQAYNHAVMAYAASLMAPTGQGPDGANRHEFSREMVRSIVGQNLSNLMHKAVDLELYEEAAVIKHEIDQRVEKGFLVESPDGYMVPQTVMGCLKDREEN